jgi:hypothetical protein
MPVKKGIGTTSSMFSLLFNTEQEALNARTLLKSKLYRYVVEQKTAGFNLPIVHMPLLNCNKSWTDEMVYKYFDITEEEQQTINEFFNNIKPKGKRGRKPKQK